MRSLLSTLFLLAMLPGSFDGILCKRVPRVKSRKSSEPPDRKIYDACDDSSQCKTNCCLFDERLNYPICLPKGRYGDPCNFSTTDDGIYDVICPCEPQLKCFTGNHLIFNHGQSKGVKYKYGTFCGSRSKPTPSKKPGGGDNANTEKPLKLHCMNSTVCPNGCCMFNRSTNEAKCHQLGKTGSQCDNNSVENIYINFCPCEETLLCAAHTTGTASKFCVARQAQSKTTATEQSPSTIPEVTTEKTPSTVTEPTTDHPSSTDPAPANC